MKIIILLNKNINNEDILKSYLHGYYIREELLKNIKVYKNNEDEFDKLIIRTQKSIIIII